MIKSAATQNDTAAVGAQFIAPEVEAVEGNSLNDKREYQLHEIAEVIDCEHKTAPKVDFSEYYSIRTTDIFTAKIDFNKANRVSRETYIEWTSRAIPEAGDIILAREAPVGEVGWIKEGYNVCLGQRTVLIKVKNEGVNGRFLLYYLANPDTKNDLQSRSSGSVVAHLNMKDIRDFKVKIPYLDEQKAIAAVLSSLDDKIDLLHRQNQTLEAMVQTLFRQWFIEEALEDWEEVPLSTLFEISSGKGLSKENFLDDGIYRVLGANGIIGRTDNYNFFEKLIYTGRVGTLGNIFIINTEPVWLSDNTLVMRNIKYFYFTYFTLKNSNLKDYNAGSTQPLLRQSDLKEIPYLQPPVEKMQEFESF